MIKPSLDTYVSYRFEDVAKEYFIHLAHSGRIKGITDIGVYWYDDKKNHTNGEFDVVLEFIDGYEFYEVKMLKERMSISRAEEEADKIRAIESFRPRKIGFVSLEGFDFSLDDYILIDGDMLYQERRKE